MCLLISDVYIAESNIRRCKYCDRQHGGSKENCPAYGQTCRKCSKASVCKSAGKRQQMCEVTEKLLTLGNGESESLL